MADRALSRLQLVDNSHRRGSDGKRLHRFLPWQLVVYPDHSEVIEPCDMQKTTPTTTTKEITGILFVNENTLYKTTGFALEAPMVANLAQLS